MVSVRHGRLTGVDGKPLRLIGVDRSGTEYSCSGPVAGGGFGYGIFQGPADAARSARCSPGTSTRSRCRSTRRAGSVATRNLNHSTPARPTAARSSTSQAAERRRDLRRHPSVRRRHRATTRTAPTRSAPTRSRWPTPTTRSRSGASVAATFRIVHAGSLPHLRRAARRQLEVPARRLHRQRRPGGTSPLRAVPDRRRPGDGRTRSAPPAPISRSSSPARTSPAISAAGRRTSRATPGTN